MKKNVRKYISILLSFFMFFQAVPVTGLANGETTSNEGGIKYSYRVNASVDENLKSIVKFDKFHSDNYYVVAYNGNAAFAVFSFSDEGELECNVSLSDLLFCPSFKVIRQQTNSKAIDDITKNTPYKKELGSSGYIDDIYFEWNATPRFDGTTGSFDFKVSRRKESAKVDFDQAPVNKGNWYLYASYIKDNTTYYQIKNLDFSNNNEATAQFDLMGTGGNTGESGATYIPSDAAITYKLLNHNDQNIIENGQIKSTVTQIGPTETYAAGYKFTFDSATNTKLFRWKESFRELGRLYLL